MTQASIIEFLYPLDEQEQIFVYKSILKKKKDNLMF